MTTFKKVFDSNNFNWRENSEYNKIFLREKQSYINYVFNTLGHVLLRDFYGILGLPITRQSCTHGWYKGILKNGDFVKFSFTQIEETSNFELVFECYPILNYLPSEESEA